MHDAIGVSLVDIEFGWTIGVGHPGQVATAEHLLVEVERLGALASTEQINIELQGESRLGAQLG